LCWWLKKMVALGKWALPAGLVWSALAERRSARANSLSIWYVCKRYKRHKRRESM
jgi:hypothetical protein